MLDKIERAAWYRLSHWLDDDDIRAKDPAYAEMQEQQIGKALADLEALEAGYLPEEIGWGEHRGSHISWWGCALVLIAGAAAIWFLMAYLL